MLIPCQAEGNFRVVRLRVLPGPVLFDVRIKGLGEHTDAFLSNPLDSKVIGALESVLANRGPFPNIFIRQNARAEF